MIDALLQLRRDARGSTIIEFAILAPIMFGLLFGVIQVGLSMQSYNAMRSISSEAARFAVVEYMQGEDDSDGLPTNDVIETQTKSIANGAPYMMLSNFDADVTDAANQRVDGAIEKTLTVTYTPPNVLPFFDWANTQLSYTRPIFVIDE